MALQVRSDALTRLIDPAAELTLLGGRFEFSEGPVWSARENRLYFHDIPGDTRWRWSGEEGARRARRRSRATAWPTTSTATCSCASR